MGPVGLGGEITSQGGRLLLAIVCACVLYTKVSTPSSWINKVSVFKVAHVEEL